MGLHCMSSTPADAMESLEVIFLEIPKIDGWFDVGQNHANLHNRKTLMSYLHGVSITVYSISKTPILLYSEIRCRGEVSASNETEMLNHVIVRLSESVRSWRMFQCKIHNVDIIETLLS